MAATIACPRCGAANSVSSQFCTNCGAALTGLPQQTFGPTPAPMMWPPPPPPSTSNATVLVVVLVIVVAVVLAGVVALLVGAQIVRTVPPGSGNPRFMGISVSRSGDGTNWSLLITSVPSGLAPSGVRLAVLTSGGSVALASTAFAFLSYPTDRAVYVQTQPGGTVAAGDRLLISTSAYPPGYSFQIADSTGVLAAGALA